MDAAASLAVRIIEDGDGLEDDLVRLLYVLQAYKAKDWPEVRARVQGHSSSGFGFLVSPLLMAWSYIGEGDFTKAEQALETLLKDERLNPLATEHIAYMQDYLGNYEAARAHYESIIDGNKAGSVQPIIALGYMLLRQQKQTEALTLLANQTQKYSSHRYLLRESFRLSKGEEPMQKAADPVGAAGLIFFRLATEFAQNNSPQSAIIYLRMASYLSPEVHDTHILLGNLFDQAGYPDEASASFNVIPADSPLRAFADARKIDVYRNNGQLNVAEALIRKQLITTPNNIMLQASLGDIMQQNRDYEGSLYYYDKVIASLQTPRAQNWDLYFARGISYEQLGKWEQAEADMLQALRLNPDQPMVLNNLAYSWIDRGVHIDRAKNMIGKALKARPDDGLIMDSMGWVHFLTGDYEKAVPLLEQAVKLEPNDATINEHLGDAYWRVGRKIEARFQWQHALDAGPKDGDEASLLDKLVMGLPALS